MSHYRRAWHPGGTYFFTHALEDRRSALLVSHIEHLRSAVAHVRRSRPFVIDAWVVLPDHFHCVMTLPPGDSDFATRWKLIKQRFSRALPAFEPRSRARRLRGERGLWQRRYWEHLVRNESDFSAHVDYVHINPLKHGLVNRVLDWPHSTFHRYVRDGRLPADWAGSAAGEKLEYGD